MGFFSTCINYNKRINKWTHQKRSINYLQVANLGFFCLTSLFCRVVGCSTLRCCIIAPPPLLRSTKPWMTCIVRLHGNSCSLQSQRSIPPSPNHHGDTCPLPSLPPSPARDHQSYLVYVCFHGDARWQTLRGVSGFKVRWVPWCDCRVWGARGSGWCGWLSERFLWGSQQTANRVNRESSLTHRLQRHVQSAAYNAEVCR